MAEPNARDAKLIQYLNEAYGKEQELEVSLQAHIAMTTRDSYKKRLKQHLTETRRHSTQVKRRIKQLGGEAETVSMPGPGVVTDAAQTVQGAANRALAMAKGPLHMIRGTGEEEMLLKNAKTEYSEEAEEIATYTAIEALAEATGDRETAKLARSIRRDEERMSSFLARLIPTLTKAVAVSEIPASQRSGSARRSSGSRNGRATRASASAARSGGRSTRSSSASRNGKASRASAASRSRGTKAASSGSRKTSGSRTTSRSSGRAKAGSRSR